MNFVKRNLRLFRKLEDDGTQLDKTIFQRVEKKFCFKFPEEYILFYTFMYDHVLDEDCMHCIDAILPEEVGYSQSYKTTFSLDSVLAVTESPDFFDVTPKYYPGDEYCKSLSPDDPERKGWDEQKKNNYMLFGSGNGGAEQFLLGIGPDNHGKVYVWETHLPETINPVYVSSSLSEFFDAMYCKAEESS